MHSLLTTLGTVAGMVFPGLGWALGCRWPAPLLSAMVVSILAIFIATLGCALGHIALNVGVLSGWLFFCAAAGGVFWWGAVKAKPEERNENRVGLDFWRNRWLVLPVVPLLVVLVWRATQQPLSGADVDFRWNYLAELLVENGTLDFYPPYTNDDFSRYFWPDGIAPLVSSVYAWTYLVAGNCDRHWTAIPVIFQWVGLLSLLYGLGAHWGGAKAGWLACAFAGCSFLLQFAFNLGQETGLTALGAGGMTYYLLCWRRDRRNSLLVAAGACATLAACAREYGLGFIPVGCVAFLFCRPIDFKGPLIFLCGALFLPVVWYGRNFSITGNPFYSLNLGHLFPVNPVFDRWMSQYADIYGSGFVRGSGLREVLRYLLVGSFAAFFGLIAGFIKFGKTSGVWVVLSVGLMTIACWVASVRYTAGGIFYSMRVLSPLWVLGCSLGGAVVAEHMRDRWRAVFIITGLTALSLDGSLRALTVPENPYRISPGAWMTAGDTMQTEFVQKDLPFLQAVAARVNGKVLSESVGAQRVFHAAGKTLVPLWSPEVAFLFEGNALTDPASRLRELGYEHLLLTRVQSTTDFLAQTGALAHLAGHVEFVMSNETYILFSISPVSKNLQRSPSP